MSSEWKPKDSSHASIDFFSNKFALTGEDTLESIEAQSVESSFHQPFVDAISGAEIFFI